MKELAGPRREMDRVHLRDERRAVLQPDLVRVDPHVRAGPMDDHAAPLHADLPAQGRRAGLVASEVHGDEARHRGLPPLRAVLRGAAGPHLPVDDLELRDVRDLRDVEVARDPWTHMTCGGVRRLLPAQDEVVPADLLDRLAQRVRGRHGIGTAQDPVRQEDRAVRPHPDRPLQGLVEGGRPHGEDDDLRGVPVLDPQRELEGVRVRRVDLARDPDPLQGLRLRVDLELLRLRYLLDAHKDAEGPAGGHRIENEPRIVYLLFAVPRTRDATHIERAPSRRSFSSFRRGAFPFISSRTTREIFSFPEPSTVNTFSVIPRRSFGYSAKSRSFLRYPPVARNVSRSVRTFSRRRCLSYDARPCAEKSPRARASRAARAAAIPEAIARSTPRNVYPLLIRKPAASPARRTPSPMNRAPIPRPSSGTRWAEYSDTFPPLISRWTLGCDRNPSITSCTSTFRRERS